MSVCALLIIWTGWCRLSMRWWQRLCFPFFPLFLSTHICVALLMLLYCLLLLFSCYSIQLSIVLCIRHIVPFFPRVSIFSLSLLFNSDTEYVNVWFFFLLLSLQLQRFLVHIWCFHQTHSYHFNVLIWYHGGKKKQHWNCSRETPAPMFGELNQRSKKNAMLRTEKMLTWTAKKHSYFICSHFNWISNINTIRAFRKYSLSKIVQYEWQVIR